MEGQILEKFTNKLIQYIEQTEVFLKAETPEYIRQLLEYEVYDSVITIVAMFTALMFAAVVFLVGIYVGKKNDYHDGSWIGAVIIGGIMSTVMAIIFLVDGTANVKKIIKINTAPKVFIIDHLRGK